MDNTSYKNDLRNKYCILFNNIIKDEKLSRLIEQCVYNTTIQYSIENNIKKTWSNNIFKSLYMSKIRSLYTNIKSDNYPNVLALAGLNDPRVPYWEPAKFVSKLRHFNKSDSLILFKTEMSQGHFGGMDRYKYLREKAFNDAYILKTYNLL